MLLHPGASADPRLDPLYLGNLLGNPFETTLAAAQLILGDGASGGRGHARVCEQPVDGVDEQMRADARMWPNRGQTRIRASTHGPARRTSSGIGPAFQASKPRHSESAEASNQRVGAATSTPVSGVPISTRFPAGSSR